MKTLFAAFFVVWLALPASAQTADAAIAAWERGEYRTAFEIWQALAERGDKDAQYGLVNLYAYGRGTPRDPLKAYMWLVIATSDASTGSPRIHRYLTGFLTAAEQAEAERRARAWLKEHGE